jgi:hypothetical protein
MSSVDHRPPSLYSARGKEVSRVEMVRFIHHRVYHRDHVWRLPDREEITSHKGSTRLVVARRTAGLFILNYERVNLRLEIWLGL